jgi:hypothetical protein
VVCGIKGNSVDGEVGGRRHIMSKLKPKVFVMGLAVLTVRKMLVCELM